MKNTFKHGDIVRIDMHDKRVKNANGEYDYFVTVWDKNGDEKSLRLNNGAFLFGESVIYQIDETNVMPIREFHDVLLYPLKKANNSHSAKFYIPGDHLSHIDENYQDKEEDEDEEEFYAHESDGYEDDYELEDEESDDELNEEPENGFDEIEEFIKISQNISKVSIALEEVLETLTKIVENRKG